MTIAALSVTEVEPERAVDDLRADECLVCYVLRQLERAGCDGTLLWAQTYRDIAAPADRGLERRLQSMGGYCDCEIARNVFVPTSAYADADDWPTEMPECGGVRRGSTVPCRQWEGAARPR